VYAHEPLLPQAQPGTEPGTMSLRLAAMRAGAGTVGLLIILILAACDAAPVPTVAPSVGASPSGSTGPGSLPPPSPPATLPPASSPAPTEPVAVVFLPLPAVVSRVPGPNDPSASVAPRSQPGAQVGTAYRYTLEHCGLLSPFDFDGSLWDVVGGLDAVGGPIGSEDEIGELINATSGEVMLVTPDDAQFRTPRGSVIALERHQGKKDYFLCD